MNPCGLFRLMPRPVGLTSLNQMTDYGRANVYDFDNSAKWVTVSDVPLLDEHTMTNDNGEPIAEVDKSALEEIARNNNRKVYDTGDPATLILGHTSDDPRAPEKPAKGFVVNYKVKPFKRDENGRVVYAIHGDYKVRHKNSHLLEDYPRRSVELWWHKKDIDPIAMLGGSSPERDLGVVLRHGRLVHVSMDRFGAKNGVRDLDSDQGEGVIRFSSRGNWSIETYTIDDKPISLRRFAKKGSGEGKVEKVMHEFKHGELHSGSKQGPKVSSRKQAVAIAMNEAGMSRNGKSKNGKPGPKRHNRECYEEDATIPGEKARYSDDLMNSQDYDGGDEFPNETEGMGAGDGGMGGDGMDNAPDETDPMLAKVFQSKQWGEMQAGIGEIKSMLEQLVGGGQGGPGGGSGAGGERLGIGDTWQARRGKWRRR